MTRANVQKVGPKQVLLGTIANPYLSHCNKILVFADIIRKAFIAQGVDFARNDKTVCPYFN